MPVSEGRGPTVAQMKNGPLLSEVVTRAGAGSVSS